MTFEEIAIVAHESNRAYCTQIGDTSQKSWDMAPDWQRDSAIDGVKFHVENPNAGDEASHNSWLKNKEENGWVYGAIKNEETKTHPCIRKFDELPKEQQKKDSLFRAIVHTLTETV